MGQSAILPVMNTALLLAATAAVINFMECPKCDKRFRIAEDGQSATVNLCRLNGESRDILAARAEKYLKMGRKRASGDPRCPLMGWSSWNTFALNISEEIILGVAQAMATNGLKEAGYLYVNIDDGFFYGHDENGRLRWHPQRFPNGMKGTVDGIHALGLKAGTYSDAGANTCGSGNGKGDPGGMGAGLYGHDAADCRLHFNEMGFDFIKVDYCGGRYQHLDERARYTEIANAIKATGRSDVRFNICRWAFPGTWAADIAESWRTTYDIRASWKAVHTIIGENLYLSAYAKPGHFNDMDMLEVDRIAGTFTPTFGHGTFGGDTGLTRDEETTHFGLWCILSSPLLIGCDSRSMSAESVKLVTNPYLLAMNQNDLGLQAYVAHREGTAYTLVKDADLLFGTSRYVALYNSGDTECEFKVSAKDLDLGGRIDVFDLVERADPGSFQDVVSVKVAPHASKFYRFDAEKRLEREVYEAETAFLTDYQELRPAKDAGTAYYEEVKGTSGGVVVRQLGNRETNDMIFRNVKVFKAGSRTLEFRCRTDEDRTFLVQIDGEKPQRLAVANTQGKYVDVKLTVDLKAGVHEIRAFNPFAYTPDFDFMRLVP